MAMSGSARPTHTCTWLYLGILIVKGVPDGRFRACKALPLPGSHQGPLILLRFWGLGGLVRTSSLVSLFAALSANIAELYFLVLGMRVTSSLAKS